MKDILNWKPEDKRLLRKPKKSWIEESNQNFCTLKIDNPEELPNDKKERRSFNEAVMGFNDL